MTLKELRETIGKENYILVAHNNKVYIDMDRSCISVGLPASYLDGMRMKISEDAYDYYTYEDLLKGEDAYFVSDGCFDMWAPKGMTIRLLIDIDDWDVILSEKLLDDLKRVQRISKKTAKEVCV